MSLTFQITLQYRDYDALVWEEFDIIDVLTSSVNIEALSAYTKFNNGYREIEFYSRIYE